MPSPASGRCPTTTTARCRSKADWVVGLNARPAATEPVGAPVSLGPCPLCGSEVIDQPKSYGCSGWQRGCKFAIWKTIAGKRIGVRTAQALLRQGRSPVLKGFESKAGKPFDARLKLDGGEVRFDFGS